MLNFEQRLTAQANEFQLRQKLTHTLCDRLSYSRKFTLAFLVGYFEIRADLTLRRIVHGSESPQNSGRFLSKPTFHERAPSPL